MADACPKTLGLEAFIHGALCYGVSGRCYWSSYMGGKSGLRGRCVQPCRRHYRQEREGSARAFSCQDFSVDVLVKILGQVKKVLAWKIEGRKKGPHYVYYTVTAYRMLRDQGNDARIKRDALDLLAQSLGREATHYQFLPQRPQKPIDTRRQTASGLFMGKVQGPVKNPCVVVRQALLPGDVLRVGYEDEAGHTICRVTRLVPKKGRYPLNLGGRKAPYTRCAGISHRPPGKGPGRDDGRCGGHSRPARHRSAPSGFTADAAPAVKEFPPSRGGAREPDTVPGVGPQPRGHLALGNGRGEHRQIGCQRSVDLAAAGASGRTMKHGWPAC